MQAYLNQIKNGELIDLVQSQTPSIIDQILQSYTIEDEASKLTKLNKSDQDGFTALHKACARGIPEIVELLLINGIDVNTKNVGGETAALLAAKRGNPIVLKLLKDYGAQMDIVDLKGQGLAHHAIYNDNVFVLMWIETGTEISLNSKSVIGQTPLHLASSLGKLNSIKFLLRKSRSNIMDRTLFTRDTCLHLAIANNQLHCVPTLLFHSSRKKSLFDGQHLHDDETTSLAHYKNMNHKTPIDLFMEQSDDYKEAHRSFSYFFKVLQMTSVQMTQANFCMFRILLFLFPFVVFSLGIVLSLLLNKYRVCVFIATTLLAIVYVRLQGHRINDIDTRPNPIFAGAYLAGIFHDIICFGCNIYPTMHGNEWQVVLTVFTLPLLAVSYLRLICTDPGRLKMSEIATTNFAEFVNEEVKQQRLNNNRIGDLLPLDRFCNVCEVLPIVGRVKHCKMCNFCVVDLDHHCLFLMKCIGRNNLRNFIVLIVLSVLLIGLFIEVSAIRFIAVCGPLSGANPIEFMLCCYSSQTWLATTVIFNTVSVVWATFMLFYQLSMISYNSPAYFHNRAQQRPTLCQRIGRLSYFLVKGTFYHSKEDNAYLTNV